MPFMIYQTDDGRVPGFEYLPCSAMTPKVGMALKLKSGQLAAAGGAETPTYFSMTEREAPCEAGERIPVIRISGDIIFEAQTPTGFSKAPGDKVQLSADGMEITAAEGGCAEIAYTDEERTRFRIVPSSATN